MSAVTSFTDAQLRAGARTALGQCLAAGPEDRVAILTDPPTRQLAEHLLAAAAELAGEAYLVLAGPIGAQPWEQVRATYMETLRERRPTVTIFAAVDDGDLLAWDEEFQALLGELGCRHANMPALDPRSLAEGMSADYDEVARFSAAVTERLAGAHEVRVRNDDGTDVLLRCDPARPWIPLTGLYHAPGSGGRLPQGETFCAPVSADGTIAARTVGYPFNAPFGLLAEPVRIEVADGRAVALHHPDDAVARPLWAWLREHENGVRVGELAIGTNPACTSLSGNLLFDENVPGVHIAFGHPFPEWTGADFRSAAHVDVVVARPDVDADGVALLRAGTHTTTDMRTRP